MSPQGRISQTDPTIERSPLACLIPRSVALLGSDYPDLRPGFEVAVGDQVSCGQVLFTDRNRPRIAFVSPVAGTVREIERGRRQTLSRVVIDLGIGRTGPDTQPIALTDGAGARETLLSRGLWPAFLSRPFGRIPDPDEHAKAIFVTAIDTYLQSADPGQIVAWRRDDFDAGLSALVTLTDGPVFVCQGPGADLTTARNGQIRVAKFSGKHPVGLPGHHLHRLMTPGPGRAVWTIGCQDVIAIGHLFRTGQFLAERVVALTGSDGSTRRGVQALLGACLRDVLTGAAGGPEVGASAALQYISGPRLAGRIADYLGRYHWQASVLGKPLPPRPLPRIFRFLSAPNPRHPRSIIPSAALEAALPTNAPPVPLMRALSVGDVEAAERLGCLDLIEEDVALLTHICTSGSDYGQLLRQVLNQMESAS